MNIKINETYTFYFDDAEGAYQSLQKHNGEQCLIIGVNSESNGKMIYTAQFQNGEKFPVFANELIDQTAALKTIASINQIKIV